MQIQLMVVLEKAIKFCQIEQCSSGKHHVSKLCYKNDVYKMLGIKGYYSFIVIKRGSGIYIFLIVINGNDF